MNLNELLHIEQVHLMRQQAARIPAEIAAHAREAAAIAQRMSDFHYNHRPYVGPAGAA